METRDEPRWLTPEERSAWLATAGLLVRLTGALDAQLQRDAGISLFEYQVLSVLSESPGRTARMSGIAAVANGSLSRLSHVTARLEKRGWARRKPDPVDGRYTLAVLTPAGWDKVVATAPGHVAEVRRLVTDPLTQAQVQHLGDIGRKIMLAIDPDANC